METFIRGCKGRVIKEKLYFKVQQVHTEPERDSLTSERLARRLWPQQAQCPRGQLHITARAISGLATCQSQKDPQLTADKEHVKYCDDKNLKWKKFYLNAQ